MLVLLLPAALDACTCWGTRWDGELRESSLGATTRSPVPALVRVSGRGIDLSPRTEGQKGREERGEERCTPLCQKVSKLTGRTEIYQPRMHCMRGRQKYYRYTHSSTGYEPSVGSVTRPPQFRHQARRNCNSRKDPYIPPNASEACSHVARRRRCRQLLTYVAIATARAGATAEPSINT